MARETLPVALERVKEELYAIPIEQMPWREDSRSGS
jgi:hypothetical protein